MNITRIFSNTAYKGEQGYLGRQRFYELAKTLLLFSVSISLFIAGIVATETRNNLLTVVAILGLLPACRSLVVTIMFFRYKGCSQEYAHQIADLIPSGALNAFDLVFTSQRQNFEISHLVVCNKSIIGFSEKKGFDENAFREHISVYLKAESIAGFTIKIFDQPDRYVERLNSLFSNTYQSVDAATETEKHALITLLQISL